MLVMMRMSLILLSVTTCWAKEPHCSKYHYEEQMLERVIKMEMKSEHKHGQMTRMKDTVERDLVLIREERETMAKEVQRMKTEVQDELTQLRQEHKEHIDNQDAWLESRLNPGLEAGGWELIFRATAGNGYNLYDAWTTGKDTTDVKPSSMARELSRHYRSATRVNDWMNVRMVRYALFENGREVAYIIFNGTGSTNMDWFDKTRVLDSSWSAVNTKGEFNYFSIIGNGGWRRFHVNLRYGGCDSDIGYTVSIDTNARKGCDYDFHAFRPQFLYSRINAADRWNREMFGRADFMAVFYKIVP